MKSSNLTPNAAMYEELSAANGAVVVPHPAGDYKPLNTRGMRRSQPKVDTLSACCIIDLPKITDQRGNLTFIEGDRHVPFPIERVYYLYDVPAGATRGGHAHKRLQQFVIAASGSFTVVVDDGRKRKEYFLNRPHYGLYIPRMVWRELENFSSGSICVVLASEDYDESDYYRDYGEFKAALRKEQASSISGSARNLPGTSGGNGHGGSPRS